jgi:hypothetical protein
MNTRRMALFSRLMCAACTGLIGVAPAQAAQTLIFHNADNPNVVLGEVVVATGEAPDEFSLRAVKDTFHGLPPQVEGALGLTPCPGEGQGPAGLSEAITRADQALNYMETDKVALALAEGEAIIGCLNNPLVAGQAARLQFLAGVTAIQGGDKGIAWDHFRAAWIYDHNITWDEAFPPAGRRVFNLAVAEARDTEAVGVELVVPAPPSGFWVDGHEVDHGATLLELTPGGHVLQWMVGGEIQTHRMAVPEGARPRLAIPALVPAELATWVGDGRTRGLVDPILALAMPEGMTALASAGGGIWKIVVGSGSWAELVAPPSPLVADFPSPEVQVPLPMPELAPGEIPHIPQPTPTWAKVGTSVLAAVGIGLATYAGTQGKQASGHGTDYDGAMALGDVGAATDAYEARLTAERSAAAAWGVAGTALVGAGAGAIISFTVVK